jgi:poly-gamma-glutamate synthesis protein (capsule biosynthesis protein)
MNRTCQPFAVESRLSSLADNFPVRLNRYRKNGRGQRGFVSLAFFIGTVFLSCAVTPPVSLPPDIPAISPPPDTQAVPSPPAPPDTQAVSPPPDIPASPPPPDTQAVSPGPVQPSPPSDSPHPPPSFLELVAVGDNLIHIQIVNSSLVSPSAAAGGKPVYDFSPIYQHIKEDIEKADVAFLNQETLFAGEAFGISGYPQFNAPRELGETITSLGFDVVNHATNHIMDKGEAAVRATIGYWETRPGIACLGIHASAEARKVPRIVEKNGIKLGFLSYTYGTNGLPVPRAAPYLVSLIDTDIMAQEIDALRPLCDYLVVSMHWGDEYDHTPTKRQEELAAFLAGHHADLVLGHHPHVLQELRQIKRPDGGETLVYFSLGNFVSAQNRLSTLLGGMARIRLVKKDGKTRWEAASLVPLVTHYERGYTGFRVYRFEDYTEELAARHGSGVMDRDKLKGILRLVSSQEL